MSLSELEPRFPDHVPTLSEPVEGRLRNIMIATLVMLFIATPAAWAEDDQLGISADGRMWGASLKTALFDPSVRWVPGDSRSASVWVRNQSTTTADLTVDLVDVRGRSLLESGDLKMLIMVDDQVIRPKAGRLVKIPSTSPTERTKITITVSFDLGAGNATQGRALSFNLIATLTQAPGEHTSPRAEAPPNPGGIADTGASIALGLVAIVALVTLIIGSVAVLRGRSGPNRHHGRPPSDPFHSNRKRGIQP